MESRAEGEVGSALAMGASVGSGVEERLLWKTLWVMK